MRALAWHGRHDVRVDTVDDPEIINPRDAIIKVTATAICGSDLHLYDGYIPTMQKGDILGHEFMGEVVEIGPKSTLTKGQRVVVPFTIACGSCYHCGKHQYSACDNGLPADNQDIAQELYGQPMSGLFGYSHMTGGYAGGQAEYVRVPFSDVGPIVIPDGIDDEKVLFSFNAVYNGTKAFVDNFTDALRNEIKDADGVTITTLMPGPVETEFFDRAGMDDTKVGSSDTKSDPADVAKDGWDAVMAGKASIVSGWKNKIEQAVANVTPAGVLAEQHRKMAEPGTAER